MVCFLLTFFFKVLTTYDEDGETICITMPNIRAATTSALENFKLSPTPFHLPHIDGSRVPLSTKEINSTEIFCAYIWVVVPLAVFFIIKK